MTKDQVNKLIYEGKFPEPAHLRELIETHISWVILCDQFVYKIKRPVHYSFLDFSTLEQRKYYCEKEIRLNRRLTENIYLDVQPVHESQDRFTIGSDKGSLVDYAVRMKKVDRNKQMDILLSKNKITEADIQRLSQKIAFFHKNTNVIHKKNFLGIREEFNDLAEQKAFLEKNVGIQSGKLISQAIRASDAFIEHNKMLFEQRLNTGYFRDCHGDLHSKNIFLLPEPQPFDCIEFNDDFRQIDVLNEVAFLCMDLEAFGRKDLSDLFFKYYNSFFPAATSDADRRLFTYYKSYRANVRAKVNIAVSGQKALSTMMIKQKP
jgi:aminoglycoside phosphotransferase family enzyme